MDHLPRLMFQSLRRVRWYPEEESRLDLAPSGLAPSCLAPSGLVMCEDCSPASSSVGLARSVLVRWTQVPHVPIPDDLPLEELEVDLGELLAELEEAPEELDGSMPSVAGPAGQARVSATTRLPGRRLRSIGRLIASGSGLSPRDVSPRKCGRAP